jgi:hypothetical protein
MASLYTSLNESGSSPAPPIVVDVMEGRATDRTPPPVGPAPAPSPVVAMSVAPEPGARTPVEKPADASTRADQADDSDTVYSAENRDVVPPKLRRQQLPVAVLTPGVEVPEGWSYLELVVDPVGAVESVRLAAQRPAPGQTLYRHRMLVAAAKAWQFAPAKRDGKPVRYVIRVALEP